MIVQMIIIALEWSVSVVSLFQHNGFNFYNILLSLSYGVVFCFLYLGILILNNHFPDSPLSRRQKRWFNYLFILNFLSIALLFSRFLSEWRGVLPYLWMDVSNNSGLFYVQIVLLLFLSLYPFVFHLIFLGGMMKLRKLIYQNSVEKWEKQFEK